MNIALIIAGGIGSRMGKEIPKQFICVKDKPIIIYTLELMQNHPEINTIQVVCVDGWQSTLADYAKKFNITKLNGIVTGGDTRYESIYNGMYSLCNVQDDDVIIVHDAVRPLVTKAVLSDTIHVCQQYGNSMTILDCVDTMYRKTTNKFTNETVNRSQIVRGQTPEAVSGKRMREMYQEAAVIGLKNDSISALQAALGAKIYFAQGSNRNIKLTTVEDIELFKALLQSKKGCVD